MGRRRLRQAPRRRNRAPLLGGLAEEQVDLGERAVLERALPAPGGRRPLFAYAIVLHSHPKTDAVEGVGLRGDWRATGLVAPGKGEAAGGGAHRTGGLAAYG